MSLVTISSKGQLVIPKKVRESLRIKTGQRVILKVEGERIVIEPIKEEPAEYFCGVFKKGPSLTKALLKERKAEKKREG